MVKRERDKGKNSNAKTIWTIVIILIIGIGVAIFLKQTVLQESPQFSPGQAYQQQPFGPSEFSAAYKDLDGFNPLILSCVKEYSHPQCLGEEKKIYLDKCKDANTLLEQVTEDGFGKFCAKDQCCYVHKEKEVNCLDYCVGLIASGAVKVPKELEWSLDPKCTTKDLSPSITNCEKSGARGLTDIAYCQCNFDFYAII